MNAWLMKKIISSIMLLAAAAMAFVSCQKQDMVGNENYVTVSGLTFASEKPALDELGKTAWDGTTVQWVRTDKIYVGYTCDGIWQNAAGNATTNAGAKIYQSIILNDDGVKTGKFHLPGDFTFSETGSKVFYGIYPSSIVSTDFKNVPDATVTIPSAQKPLENSFDSAADLMIGVSDAMTTITAKQEISLAWTRLVAHAELTFSNLPQAVSGEKVETVVLTANADADMVGAFSVNLETKQVTRGTGSNVLTIDGANLNAIDETGKFIAWASVLPFTMTSLDVVVETDKATYTRSITGISKVLKQNARNTLTINMKTADRVEKSAEELTTATLVTDASTLVVGDEIVIVASKYDVALGAQDGNYRTGSNVTRTESQVSFGSGTQVITLAEGNAAGSFALKVEDGKYLYATGETAVNIKTQDSVNDAASWTITIEKNIATIRSKIYSEAERMLQYQNSSIRFASWKGGNTSVQIYKLN